MSQAEILFIDGEAYYSAKKAREVLHTTYSGLRYQVSLGTIQAKVPKGRRQAYYRVSDVVERTHDPAEVPTEPENEHPYRPCEYHVYALVDGEAYRDSGLGYHCDPNLMVTGLSGGLRWDVDHLKSGYRIACFHSQARARVFLEEIATYTDWNRSVEDLQADTSGLWMRVQEARKAADTWQPTQTRKIYTLRRQLTLLPDLRDT